MRPGGSKSLHARASQRPKEWENRPSLGWEHFLESGDTKQALRMSKLEPGEGPGIPLVSSWCYTLHTGVTSVGSGQSETVELTYLSRNSDSQLLICKQLPTCASPASLPQRCIHVSQVSTTHRLSLLCVKRSKGDSVDPVFLSFFIPPASDRSHPPTFLLLPLTRP